MPGTWRVSFHRLGDPTEYQVRLHLMHDDPMLLGRVRAEMCEFGRDKLEARWRTFDDRGIRGPAFKSRKAAGEWLAERWVK
jgi:hypothetical protein